MTTCDHNMSLILDDKQYGITFAYYVINTKGESQTHVRMLHSKEFSLPAPYEHVKISFVFSVIKDTNYVICLHHPHNSLPDDFKYQLEVIKDGYVAHTGEW